MQIESFTIEKQSSYAAVRPGEMLGKVTLSGPSGKQEVILQTATLVQVFSVIRQDLINASKKNAEMTKAAIDEAVHGPLLGGSMQVPELT